MKITVITVALNSARTIADTLKSVASQSYPDVEHVIIDGGSTDATLALARQWGRTGMRVLSEPDTGIYDAMNKGLRLAEGDLVGFLNADDVFNDAEVLAVVAAAANDRRVDAVYGDLVYVANADPERVVRHWRSGKWAPRRLRFGWMPPHPTLYVRRALIEQLGGFDRMLRIAADYDFMLRVLRRPGINVAYVNKVLVRMRMGGISNRSLRLLLRKSREDLISLRRNEIGGWLALICKNVRKLPQFMASQQ